MALSFCLCAFAASITPVSAVTTYAKNMENECQMMNWGWKEEWHIHLLLSVDVSGGYIVSDDYNWVFEDLPGNGNWQINTSWSSKQVSIIRVYDEEDHELSIQYKVRQKVENSAGDQWVCLGAWINITSAGSTTYDHYYWENHTPWYHYTWVQITVTNWV